MIGRMWVLVVLVSLCDICLAQPLPSPLVPLPQGERNKGEEKTRNWTVDDVVNAESASDFRIAPDGRRLAWVKLTPDDEKGEALGHIFLTSLTDDTEVQLTRGTDDCTDPRWSPDGKRLAFITARPNPKSKTTEDEDEPEAQVWLINPAGGEAWPLTEDLRGITDLAWADNDTLIVSAKEKATHYERELKDGKDTALAVEDERQEPPVRLFQVAVDSGKVKRLTGNRDWIKWFVPSPDRSKAVVLHERSLRYNYDHEIRPALFLCDLKTGEEKPLLADGKHRVESILWALDGKGFYAICAHTSHPRYLMAYVLEVHYHDLKCGQTTNVDLGWEKGLTFTYETDRIVAATPDGFVALLADGVRNKFARFTRTANGWKRDWITGEHHTHIQQVHMTPDGRTLLYQHSTASSPPRYYRAKLEADKLTGAVELLHLEPDYHELACARQETIHWKGARGAEVEGLLFYPRDYQKGKKYPLIVSIHGGPFGSDFDAWEEDWASAPNLLCDRGAFVFRPNYHGSCNYGLEFAESIANGKYYELPITDIEKGVDALIERGLVDPERLGVMGWSNGAILTMALIVHNPRYKAAVAGAGGSEWVGDWGTCEFGAAFDHYYFGKSPLEDPQLYIKMAPFYQLAKVRTPTLIFQGEADRVVPVHHGWMQFRALQLHSKAPVRLVLFPGEEHSLTKLAHQRRKLKEELAWFDRHLFNTLPVDHAVKDDSPLDRLLKLGGAARQGRRFGVNIKGTLTPETIRRGDLEVGRFEVTRAQFAEFDYTYKFEPGTENYPANGISFDKAKAYCAWLSKKTGERFELGTVKELTPIYDEPADTENTLDYWAGYKVTPHDAETLQRSIAALGKSLLKEVGSFAGVGEKDEQLFDVGGNVAEWATTADGTGRLLGGSAIEPADEAGTRVEYAGFRVVKRTRN